MASCTKMLINALLISLLYGEETCDPMRKLIIDTDGVSDDIRAISLALQHPNAEVVAITTVQGCVSVDQATANVFRTQRANGVERFIPIFKGARYPFIRREFNDDVSYFFGKDGIGDVPDTEPKSRPEDCNASEDEHAALALIRLTKEQDDITLVAIGPLTNLALALKLDPNFAQQPKNLVIMGGNYLGIGNVHSNSSAEYNFFGDPEAASIVLEEMQCPITIVPWEAFYLEGPEHEKEVNFTEHMMYDTVLGNYLLNVTERGRKRMESNGRQYTFCDEIAVATAIDAEAVVKKSKKLRAKVELHGQFTRGQVMVDWTSQLFHDDEIVKNCEGKVVDLSRKPFTFVTSYDVHVVNKWMHDACRNANHSLEN